MYSMMTYYEQLSKEIEKLRAEGKIVSIKQLQPRPDRLINSLTW